MKCLRCKGEMLIPKTVGDNRVGDWAFHPDGQYSCCNRCNLELETNRELTSYTLNGLDWKDVPEGCLLIVKDKRV